MTQERQNPMPASPPPQPPKIVKSNPTASHRRREPPVPARRLPPSASDTRAETGREVLSIARPLSEPRHPTRQTGQTRTRTHDAVPAPQTEKPRRGICGRLQDVRTGKDSDGACVELPWTEASRARTKRVPSCPSSVRRRSSPPPISLMSERPPLAFPTAASAAPCTGEHGLPLAVPNAAKNAFPCQVSNTEDRRPSAPSRTPTSSESESPHPSTPAAVVPLASIPPLVDLASVPTLTVARGAESSRPVSPKALVSREALPSPNVTPDSRGGQA
ncbi:hypothetical protein GSI_05698 [Ganoderma sinense ZZ0214-1]|uniref:Uncharacterized protein n=1 Tax=Ganoderma sinense ZZ0214-1 TaxID=1077348 RepID=A0A2G8SB61_9APHY|nr:hypothetical protein GSI_05698 [Ganoderma sinense ZZ0214-1]